MGNEGNNFDFPIQILAIDMAVNKEKQKGTKKEFKIRVKPGRRNEHSPVNKYFFNYRGGGVFLIYLIRHFTLSNNTQTFIDIS